MLVNLKQYELYDTVIVKEDTLFATAKNEPSDMAPYPFSVKKKLGFLNLFLINSRN